jgi:hypothetical protein
MKRHPLQLLVLVAMATVFLLSFAIQDAQASHFRGGHLTWNKVAGTADQVNIKFRSFWRYLPTAGRIVDGNGAFVTSIPVGTVVASGTDLAGGAWQIFENNLTVTLTGPSPHILEITPSCCRIGALVNAADNYWRIQTVIDLASGQTGSTVSSLPPILQVSKGPNTISIPVADPDGNDITCRLATAAESSIACAPGLSRFGCSGGPAAVVTNNCFIIWDATNQANKAKHAIQIALEQGGSRTSLDIIMEVNGGLVNNAPPTCSSSGSINNTGAVGQLFSISATGTDPEGNNLTINHQGIPGGSTLSPANGTLAPSPATATWSYTPTTPGETHAVTLTFTDDGNQTCQTSFTLSTPDNQAPVANAGVDQIIEQTGPGAVSVVLNGSGSTDPDGDALTYAWSGGASATGATPTVLLAAGSHNINLTVNDGTVNSAPDSVQIIVQDTIAPVITVGPRTEEATGPSTLVDVTGNATATDAVGVASLTHNSPGTFAVGVHTVTWTATDAAGNSSTATQSVTVQDTIAPVITVGPRTEEATGPSTPVDVTGNATATDAVGVVTLTNDSPGSFPANATSQVTWTASDAAGNTSTAVQNVTIQDTIAPALTAPVDVTATATGVLTIVNLGSPVSSDAVGVVSQSNDAPVAGFPVDSTTTVTWTVSDAAGNTTTATQTVTVLPFDLGISVGKTKLKIHHGDDDKDKDKDKDHDRGPKDWLQVAGTLTEFSNGDGLNFLTDAVTITLNGFTWNLPAGSFVLDDGEYEYKGGHTGLTEFEVEANGKFKMKVKGMDLSGLPFATPIPFSVTIGNDFGQTHVTFNTRRGKDDDDKGKDKDHDKREKKEKRD